MYRETALKKRKRKIFFVKRDMAKRYKKSLTISYKYYIVKLVFYFMSQPVLWEV